MAEKWITDSLISWDIQLLKTLVHVFLFLHLRGKNWIKSAAEARKCLAPGQHGQELLRVSLLRASDLDRFSFQILCSLKPSEADLKWTILAVLMPETLKAQEIPSLKGLDFWKDFWMSSVLFLAHPLPKLQSECRTLAGEVLWLSSSSIKEVEQKEKLQFD